MLDLLLPDLQFVGPIADAFEDDPVRARSRGQTRASAKNAYKSAFAS